MRVFDSLAYSPKELEKWKLDHEKWHKDIVDKFPPKVDQYKKALKYVDRAIIVKKNDMYSNEKIARDLKLSEITIERIVTEINFMKLEELEELREMLLGKECRHDSTENERRILEYRKSR